MYKYTSLLPRPSLPSICHLVLQVTNAGVRRPGYSIHASVLFRKYNIFLMEWFVAKLWLDDKSGYTVYCEIVVAKKYIHLQWLCVISWHDDIIVLEPPSNFVSLAMEKWDKLRRSVSLCSCYRIWSLKTKAVIAVVCQEILILEALVSPQPLIPPGGNTAITYIYFSCGNRTPGSWYNSLVGQTHLSESCLRSYSHLLVLEQTPIASTSSYFKLSKACSKAAHI